MGLPSSEGPVSCWLVNVASFRAPYAFFSIQTARLTAPGRWTAQNPFGVPIRRRRPLPQDVRPQIWRKDQRIHCAFHNLIRAGPVAGCDHLWTCEWLGLSKAVANHQIASQLGLC